MANKKLVHLGDLGVDLTTEQLDKIKDCDVVFIPVGGKYTIDGNKASEIAKKINAKTTIAMHFKTDKAGFSDLSTADNFINAYGKDKVKILSSPSFILKDEDSKAIVMPFMNQSN